MSKKYDSDISNEIDDFITKKGFKKYFVADRIGTTRQNFDRQLKLGLIKADQYIKIAKMGGVEISLEKK